MNTGRSQGGESGCCAAQLLSSPLHLQVTEAHQVGRTPKLCCVEWSGAMELLESLPRASPVPPLPCHGAVLLCVSCWSSSPTPGSYCQCRHLLQVVRPEVPGGDTGLILFRKMHQFALSQG